MKRVIPVLAAFALFACDDGDGSSEFSSGIETSKTVSSLTDAEGEQYCAATERSFVGLISKRKGCELGAVFFAEDQQTCNFFVDECVKAPAEDPEPDGFAEEEPECRIAQAENREGCDETIETLDGCIGSIQNLARNALGKISCGDAGNIENLESKFADLPMDLAGVPGCESLAANCPKLFDEGGPMEMVMGEPGENMDGPGENMGEPSQ